MHLITCDYGGLVIRRDRKVDVLVVLLVSGSIQWTLQFIKLLLAGVR